MKEHRQQAANVPVCCQVITVSDTRTPENDKSGSLIIRLLENEQIKVADYVVAKDDAAEIRAAIFSAADEVNVVLLNGGTGFTKRDVTAETVKNMLDKEMVGFGELFRYLSYQEIGSASMLSRAVAGTVGRKALFCMPGSANAVRLAMEKLILPEIRHIVWELHRQ